MHYSNLVPLYSRASKYVQRNVAVIFSHPQGVPTHSGRTFCCYQSRRSCSYPTRQQGSYRSRGLRFFILNVCRRKTIRKVPGHPEAFSPPREWSMVCSQSSSKRILFGCCAASRQFILEATKRSCQDGFYSPRITGLSCSQHGRKWAFSK